MPQASEENIASLPAPPTEAEQTAAPDIDLTLPPTGNRPYRASPPRRNPLAHVVASAESGAPEALGTELALLAENAAAEPAPPQIEPAPAFRSAAQNYGEHYPDDDDSATDPPPGESQAELEYLKQMLAQQRRTALEAQRASSELEKQLDDARTELSAAKGEVAKTKTEYRAAPKAARQVFSNQAAEIATLRAGLYQAEKQLAREHQIRETEAKKASRKVNELTIELAVVQQAGANIPTPGFWKRRRGRKLILASAAVAAAVLAAVLYSQLPTLRPNEEAPDGRPPGTLQAAVSVPSRTDTNTSPDGSPATPVRRLGRSAENRPPPSTGKSGDFSHALDQLDYALQAFPGVKPEEVLRAVYRSNKECALVWNDGHPSLLFGSGALGADSLASTLAQCAKAVEKLH